MTTQTTRRGAFVVLEGLDRSGKSTQCSLLVERLRSAGIPTQAIHFPDRVTAIGKMIDAYLAGGKQDGAEELDDRAIHLLFCANRWERRASILKALAEGTTLVCDRYAFSGVAFTAAKSLLPPSPDLLHSLSPQPDLPTLLHTLAAPDAGLPLPDLTLFLSLSPAATSLRGGFGIERYETSPMQAAVRDVFSREDGVKGLVKRTHGEGRWKDVDAEGGMEEVAERVWEAVREIVKVGKELGPIGTLWEGA